MAALFLVGSTTALGLGALTWQGLASAYFSSQTLPGWELAVAVQPGFRARRL